MLLSNLPNVLNKIYFSKHVHSTILWLFVKVIYFQWCFGRSSQHGFMESILKEKKKKESSLSLE